MKKILIVLALFLMPVLSRAETPRSELLLNGMQATLKAGNGTALTATAGYNFSVTPMIQLGLMADLLYTNVAGLSSTTLDALGGITLNFPINGNELQSAIFIEARAGFEVQSVGFVSPLYFVLEGSLGKRFEIIHDFCYRPTLGFQLVSGNVNFLARVLSFSVRF